jgi:hypothetical protein
MNKKYYEKDEDGNFVEAGYEFTGWPANGIWVVEEARQNCIYQFKGNPEQPTPALISYMRHQDELQELISKEWNDKALSVRDISKIACEFFAIKAGAMKINGEILEN